ncbi:MAG TPA: hypothetical protein VLK65_09095 [Vicinamibacteria bacterium]|nr:hypothetical protein [Vicinamibacteria bacterium]
MLELLVLSGLAVAIIVTAAIAVLGVLVSLVVGVIALPFKLLGATLGGAFELLLLPFKIIFALALGIIVLSMGGCLLVFAC